MKEQIKIINCSPEGKLELSDDLFNKEAWEIINNLEDILVGEEELQLAIMYADYCADNHMEKVAIDYYIYVLEHTIENNKNDNKPNKLAEKAYNRLVGLSHSNDDYIWETCIAFIDKYEHLFSKKENT